MKEIKHKRTMTKLREASMDCLLKELSSLSQLLADSKKKEPMVHSLINQP